MVILGNYINQPIVIDCLMSQYDNGENIIGGVMIESNLKRVIKN